MKKLLILTFALLFIALCFTACAAPENPSDETTPAEDTTTTADTEPVEEQVRIKLCDANGLYYKIVRPDLYTDAMLSCMQQIATYIKEKSGYTINLSDDWVRKGTDTSDICEILVGFTARDETREVMEKTNPAGYSVAVCGKKIVIASHDEKNLQAATDYFCENCLSFETDAVGKNIVYYVGNDVYGTGDAKFLFGADNPLSEYCVVCNKSVANLANAADAFVKAVSKAYGVELEVKDQTAAETEKEIVIGKTNRAVSTEFGNTEAMSYTAAVSGKKFYIGSSSDYMTLVAVNTFCDKYVNGYYSYDLVVPADYNKKEQAMTFNDPAALADGADIRIMSFNLLCELWNDRLPVDGRDSIAVGTIMYYSPDVIGIQEVSDMWYKSFDKLFGTTYVITDRKNEHGNTNFSTLAYNTEKVKLIEHGVKEFSQGNDPKLRLVTWGLFEKKDTGKRFIAMTTHWDLGSNAQYQKVHSNEMAAIALDLKTKYNVPVVTTGDYNVNESSEYYKNFITKTGFYDSKYTAETVKRACKTTHSVGTPPADKNAECIDHIFGSSDAKFLYYNVLIDKIVSEASDHSPIYADVKFMN